MRFTKETYKDFGVLIPRILRILFPQENIVLDIRWGRSEYTISHLPVDGGEVYLIRMFTKKYTESSRKEVSGVSVLYKKGGYNGYWGKIIVSGSNSLGEEYSPYDVLNTIAHELRHSWQYLHPDAIQDELLEIDAIQFGNGVEKAARKHKLLKGQR